MVSFTAYVLAKSGDNSTNDGQRTKHGYQKQLPVDRSRRSVTESNNGAYFGNGEGARALGAKRRKTASRASSQVEGADSVEAGGPLKVLGGGQPLVDDCDDEDFEARKVGNEISMVGGADNW